MYQERYDPLLHPDEHGDGSSARSHAVMVSALVSGSLLLYALIAAIT